MNLRVIGLVQYKKMPAPTGSVNELGIVSSVMPVFAKAQSPIPVSVSGSVIEVSPLHPENTELPICVRPLGRER